MLAPGISGDGDGSELTLALHDGAIPHPTGYPLYTLFGHLWVRGLELCGVAAPRAANLWSALAAALALGLLYRLTREWTGPAGWSAATPRIPAGALAATLLLAVNPIWTNEALLAEVYAGHVAWVLVAALLFVRLKRRIDGVPIPSPGALLRGGAAWGFLAGLGVSHHLTSICVSVPLTLLLAVAAVRRGLPVLRPGGAALGWGLVPPLAAYGWLAWRAGASPATRWPLLEPNAASIVEHVTGGAYRHFMGRFAPSDVHAELLTAAGYPVLVTGALALVLLLLRPSASGERSITAGLGAAALAGTLLAFRYGVPDPAPYFLPALALGLAAAGATVDRISGPGRAARFGAPLLVAAIVAVVAGRWGPATPARLRELAAFETTARSMWAAVPDDAAIVFWPDDRYQRLKEYQVLRGEKRGIYVTTPEMLVNGRPRAEFSRRFGFDPLAGLTLPVLTPGMPGERAAIDRFLVALVRNVTERSAGPVILVDPSVPSVRQLRRSGSDR